MIDKDDNDFRDEDFLEARKATDDRLTIFFSQGIDFYLGMKSLLNDYKKFDSKFRYFMSERAEDFAVWTDKSASQADRIKAESKIQPTMNRFLRQRRYLDLSILYHYSIFIEDSINRDEVVVEHHLSKTEMLSIGVIKFKSTNSMWPLLVSCASNYSRHFAEWDLILKSVVDLQLTTEEKLEHLRKVSKQAYLSISKLVELEGIERVLHDRYFDFPSKIAEALDLHDLTASHRRVMTWLLRMEKIWAKQVKDNPGKYFPKV